jgi:hypothetical protein
MNGRTHSDPPAQDEPGAGSSEEVKLAFDPRELQGFKYFKMLGPLLERLHGAGAERDKAGSRPSPPTSPMASTAR